MTSTQQPLGDAVLAHDPGGEQPAVVAQLEVAVAGDVQQPVALHPGDGLRDGGAGVAEPLGDAGAQRRDALLLELEDGAEVHLRGVDEVRHVGKPTFTRTTRGMRPPTAGRVTPPRTRGGARRRVVLGQPAGQPGAADEGHQAHRHAGDPDRRDRGDGPDHQGGAVVADEREQPPHAEERRPPDGGGGIRAQGHDDAGAEAVADAHEQRQRPDAGEGGRERQGHQPQAEQQGDRHGDPDPPVPVHDRAGRVEEHHLDERGGGEDERGLRGVEARRARPTAARRPPATERASPMASTPRPTVSSTRRFCCTTRRTGTRSCSADSSRGVRRGPGCARPAAREQAGDDGHRERRLRPPARDDRRADQRPDEQADPGDATEGRHRPGAQGHRGGGGEVALPGERGTRRRWGP